MGKDKLEHSIKSKLSSYESAINTDSLWAGIQTGLAETSATTAAASSTVVSSVWTSKLAVGLSALAATIITIGGIWYFTSDNFNEQNKEKQSVVTEQPISNNINTKTSNTNTPKTIESTNKELVQSQNTNTAAVLNVETQNPVSNNTATQAGNTIDATIETSASKNTTTQAYQQANTAAEHTNNTPLGSNPNNNNASAPITSQDEMQTVPTQDFRSTQNQAETAATDITEIESTKVSDVSAANIAISNNEQVEEQGRNSVSFALLDNYMTDVNYNNGELDLGLQLPNKKIECPGFGGNSNKGFFVGELQVIPYYSIPRITASSDLGEIWKTNKENTESYLETFQVNLLGRYELRNGLYFDAGVGYGQLDEKFEFNFSETIVTDEDDVPVIIIIRPDGMNDTIVGTGTVTVDTTAVYETFNYHRMAELNVALGYEIPVNNALSIYGDVGLSINIFTSRTGFHLLDDIDAVEFPSESRPVYKTSTGYKLTGSLGLRYYSGNTVLSVGPQFRSHLTNWIRDEHPISLKYFDIGLRMSVGYVF